MTTDNNIELKWKPTLNFDGNQRIADDGTKIVETDPITVIPEATSKWGNWKFKNIEGWWSYRGAASDIQQNVAISVVLQLGKQNTRGERYKNIISVEKVDEPLATGDPIEESELVDLENELQHKPKLQGIEDVGTNASIREQAFFNNLNMDILNELTEEKKVTLLSAYFDTGMLMIRESVRTRALQVMQEHIAQKQLEEQEGEETEETDEVVLLADMTIGDKSKEATLNSSDTSLHTEIPKDSPSVAKAKELGGKVIEDKKEDAEADDNEEITDLPW